MKFAPTGRSELVGCRSYVEASGKLESMLLHQVLVGEQLPGRAVRDDATSREKDRPRAEVEGVGKVVRHEEHGDVQALDDVSELPSRCRIQV